MTEAEFKSTYITQFLAAYMAQTYERDCHEGHRGEPYNHQPVEDAAFLADCAWKQVMAQGIPGFETAEPVAGENPGRPGP